MKLARLVMSMALAFSLCGGLALAEDAAKEKPKYTEGSCCDKAAKDGKECDHPCCKKAAEDGKVCEKCNKPKEEKKEE